MTTLRKDPSPANSNFASSPIKWATEDINKLIDRVGGETALTGNRVIVTDVDGNMAVSSVGSDQLDNLLNAGANGQVAVVVSDNITYQQITNTEVSSTAGIEASKFEAGTKGDVFISNGTNFIKLGIGTNGQVLTADSAEASGVKWATPAGGGDMVLADAQTNTGIKTFLDTTMKLRNVANTFDGYFVNTNTADRVYTLQDSSDTLVGRATTDTLTNKTVDEDSNTIKVTKYKEAVPFEWTTDVATGDGKFYTHVPPELDGYNLTYVHAEVITAGTTGTTDIQIYNVDNALDMLSTKLTIDSGETGSDTAATPAVINTSNDHVNTNDVLRIDVDAVSTTAPKGLIITMGFKLP
jgi:hypothetical protein